ncbi:MAG: sigma-54-dependent Fis family transcriptional regulator [Gemmatimonadetes bacterium]|nr:sigma-54-dependent Fis family transcriptional regulator [Gemmatimonadota bacterium]
MTNQKLVDLYQWLRRLAQRLGRQSGEGALDSVRAAAEDRLGTDAAKQIGTPAPDTGGLPEAHAWAVHYLSGVVRTTREEADQFDQDTSFVGYHHDIVGIRSSIGDLAASPHPVLLIGERGTGKGQLMRAIHRELAGNARDSTMHLFSLAATPPDLADSELFGHVKGAFTGAASRRLGVIQKAAGSGNALFLDDIGECPKPVQAKLLSALDDGIIRPVGSDTPIDIGRGKARKLRVFASIQPESLDNLRPDLRDRLWLRPQIIPPLRSRGLDMLLLADLALDACSNGNAARPRITQEVRRRLLAELWPGNVRELISLVTRAADASRGRPELDLAAISDARRADQLLHGNGAGHRCDDLQPFDGPNRFLTLEETTERHIGEALSRSGGNISLAAKMLGMPRSTLDSRLKKL